MPYAVESGVIPSAIYVPIFDGTHVFNGPLSLESLHQEQIFYPRVNTLVQLRLSLDIAPTLLVNFYPQ
ncbi:hypothetical protein Y032_0110g182 [Ancylostoma ceylanicum]|uniref:Uncharacterized protein n=1 Tax=Ancylostoma ceylanicum TaxID=53326 RepID=A0A016TEV8_9BILA|nr:hypothetical protein Y032_0110g182 [Ancylostoma ceylanicum]